MTIVYAPAAAVNAKTAKDLPGGAKLQKLTRVVLIKGSDMTQTVLTITADEPDAGEVRLVGATKIEFGDALAAVDIVVIEGDELGARPVA